MATGSRQLELQQAIDRLNDCRRLAGEIDRLDAERFLAAISRALQVAEQSETGRSEREQ